MVISIIIAVIAVALIFEGFFVAIFPKQTKSITRKLLKIKDLRKVGIMEAIVGIILLLIAVLLNIY